MVLKHGVTRGGDVGFVGVVSENYVTMYLSWGILTVGARSCLIMSHRSMGFVNWRYSVFEST